MNEDSSSDLDATAPEWLQHRIIDTTAADIWQQVEALWEQNQTGGGNEDTIAAASGIVYH